MSPNSLTSLCESLAGSRGFSRASTFVFILSMLDVPLIKVPMPEWFAPNLYVALITEWTSSCTSQPSGDEDNVPTDGDRSRGGHHTFFELC